MLVQLFPWQFPQVVTKSKPFLRQGQLLAPHEVFVECLQLHLSKFNSSAGPGSKIVYIASKLLLQFFHSQSVGEKSVWSSFFYLRIWQCTGKLWCSAADSVGGNLPGFIWVFDEEYNTPCHNISCRHSGWAKYSFWACAFLQLVLGGKQTFSQWKMSCHCAVTGCSNGDFWLNQWHKD